MVCTGFAQGLYKAPKIKTAEPLLRDCGLHRASRQIKTASKGIIRKECQSFTNHGHAKTPPTVFNPLSLWLTLPQNMGGQPHTMASQHYQSHSCAPVVCTGFAQGLYKAPKNQNSRSIHTAASFICKAYMYMALKKCHLPVSPLAEVSAWHMFFSKTTFSSGLMITKLKSNTKTTGWNKRPGASPTLTTRRNSPGTSRESIANQKDF